jgi:ribosomal protein S18 acetylase RimI-like enzyme
LLSNDKEMSIEIRSVQKSDLQDLKLVIETSGLFPPDLLDEMLEDFFTNEKSEHIWLTSVANGNPIAVSFCAPERLTEGTYNLYLIAVHKNWQRRKIGGQLVNHIEQLLLSRGNRILLVETSGLPEFDLTRRFYDKCGYTREAIIRDFYRKGEDKVVFWKALAAK